jgi:Cu-processing system ATP-binding protein
MIKVQSVIKRYGNFNALDGVSLDLGEGECIALIGPNGSGKSTMMKSILGLVLIDSGDILFEGKSVVNEWQYREKIGYMPQNGRYPDHMRVGQVIEMMSDIRKCTQPDLELHDGFGLENFYEKEMNALSGGMRQKVNASLAFMFRPDVFILDEPTAGLDPISVEILKEKIDRVCKQGKLVIITSHVLSDLDDLISRVVYMQDGNVLFSKERNDLMTASPNGSLSKALAATMKSL